MSASRVDRFIEREATVEVLATLYPRKPWFKTKLREAGWTARRLLKLDKSPSTFEKAVSSRGVFSNRVDPNDPGRLLVDVTSTATCGYVTGIQRVVREIVRVAPNALPVLVDGGQMYAFVDGKFVAIVPRASDTLLLADRTWEYSDDCIAVMAELDRVGARTIALVYDIIALRYPALFPREIYPDTIDVFRRWFVDIALQCDAIICISKHVARDIETYARENDLVRAQGQTIHWNHLGADHVKGRRRAPSSAVRRLVGASSPFFISVGTLETRKGIAIALDAFDRLWNAGINVRYVICGRYGWGATGLAHRIVSHPLYGKQLFWLRRASDNDLDHLYRGAEALIFASVVEGFGLPLVEAAERDLHCIASDIDVFKEVGGDHVSYLPVGDAEGLERLLKEVLITPRDGNGMPRLTWSQSIERLVDLIDRERHAKG